MDASKPRGFTLIEMLVVMAIAAILAALAAPSVRDFLVRNTMNGIASEFQAGVLRARNEAVNRNICTTMCMSTTTANASPVCVISGDADWQQGWIIFFNTNCDTALDKPANEKDIFAMRQSTGIDYLLMAQGNTRKINFNSRGYNAISNADELDLIYQTANSALTKKFGLNICVDALGRTRVIPEANSCANYK